MLEQGFVESLQRTQMPFSSYRDRVEHIKLLHNISYKGIRIQCKHIISTHTPQSRMPGIRHQLLKSVTTTKGLLRLSTATAFNTHDVNYAQSSFAYDLCHADHLSH